MSGAFSEADLLAVVDRFVDPDWLQNIKAIGPGYELIKGQAAILARASLAVSRADDCEFIATAPAGKFATGLIRFRRQSSGMALTIKAGSIVATPQGRRFFLVQDIPVGSGDTLTTSAPIVAEYQGYEWNVLGADQDSLGNLIPGEISVAVRVLQDPPFADPTFIAENVNPTVGGEPAVLGAHGKDRGMAQQPGEAPESYRERIRSLPLVVTGPKLLQAITAIVAPFGVTPILRECFDPAISGALDWPSGDAPFVPDLPGGAWALDGRWLDCLYAFGTFFMVLPWIQPAQNAGLVLDDPAVTLDDLVSPSNQGERALCCYDLNNDEAGGWTPGVLDGQDDPLVAMFQGVQSALDRAKLGGVFAVVIYGDGAP